jgi:hypothetical protein
MATASDSFHVPLDLRMLIGAALALIAVMVAVTLVVYYSAIAGQIVSSSAERLHPTTVHLIR